MSQSGNNARSENTAGPHIALLHSSMLLSGFGTVFLGVALPSLAATAGVSDSGSGLFFTAQFAGAFLGGVTTSERLRTCLLRGLSAAAAGFGLLALCAGLHAPVIAFAAALLVMGFGVGQTLTSVNLLTSRRYQAERSSALALVNFSWSFGAVTAPFLLGNALSAFPFGTVLRWVTAVFVLVLAAVAWNGREEQGRSENSNETALGGLTGGLFAIFAAMLLLYGGVETCLSGWITTFAARYAGAGLRAASLDVTGFWIGITAGRALTPLLLRLLRERTLLFVSIALSTVMVGLLSQALSGAAILCIASILGLSMAPWFPLVLAAMLRSGASARQTGLIIAVSGIGAAILPAALGAVSHASGSLRLALVVPGAGLALLLLLALFIAPQGSSKSV